LANFKLLFSREAQAAISSLSKDQGAEKRLRAVRKTLALLETNPRHPGLHTHQYSKLIGPNGEKVFEAYAENKTPAAFRVFWHYGPRAGQMTIVAITPHP
jgi:hypothetical protein